MKIIKKLDEMNYTNNEEVLIEASFLSITYGKNDPNGVVYPMQIRAIMEETGEIINLKSFLFHFEEDIARYVHSTRNFELTVLPSLYRDEPQLLLTGISSTGRDSTKKKIRDTDPKKVEEDIKKLVNDNVTNELYLKLLDKFIFNNPEYFKQYAGVRLHHDFIGGLAYHSRNVAKGALQLSVMYENEVKISKDLIITGGLLHDIGKLKEYQGQGQYNPEGQLFGHLFYGVLMIQEACIELGIDLESEEVKMLLHVIGSHHDQLEWGALTTPKIIEAILIAQVDAIDARVDHAYKHLNEVEEGEFSERSNLVRISFYNHKLK